MGSLTNKKILYVITKSNWGGAQAQVYTLATHYHENGAEVLVALGGTGERGAPTGRLAEQLAAAGVRTVFLRSFARDVFVGSDIRALIELVRLYRKERPEVVHLHSSKAGGLGSLAARLAGVPKIIFTSHGLAYDEDRSRPARALIWLSTWMTFLLCHTVIVISQDTYLRARTLLFCRKKICLVYNGIAEQHLLARDEARGDLLPLPPPEGTLWVGTIAELTHNKGLTYLLQAAALLKKRGVSFVLCIMGTEGEERPLLEQIITEEGLAGCVHLLGFVPNGATYLSAFDVFTLTSVKEGLPYVLLEAAQAQCAVVASNIPGVTDILDTNTGVLVPPKDVTAIADALEMLSKDSTRRAALGTHLHKKAATHFSLAHMYEQISALYG